jgi:predicted transcriptional regulator
VVLALSFSFATVIYAQNSLPRLPLIQNVPCSNRLFFSATLMLGAGLHDNSGSLNQTTRIEIYNYVKSNPGVHFRGICRNLGLSVGVVQYHLGFLRSGGLLSVFNDGQYRRYFESSVYTERDAKLISLLRHDQPRRILAMLFQNGPTLHKDLTRELCISSQALTWQMGQLKTVGIVEAVKEGMSVKYLLNAENKTALSSLLGLVNALGV